MNFPDRLRGIVTVLNTPFTEGGGLDCESLARNVAYALDAGVAGFLVPAMAAEVMHLREGERERMTACVLEQVAGRVPVIGGASAATPDERLHWVRRLTALGCDGILVSIPFSDEAGYRNEVFRLAESTPPFLMLQDWDASGYGVPVPLLATLFAEVPCFTCLKIEVADAMRKYREMLKATNGRLHVSCGWGITRMLESLDAGVHALMPTGMHRAYTRIYDLYRQHRREEAETLFARLQPILAFSNRDLDVSILFFKQLLHCQGIYDTDWVRTPLHRFSSGDEQLARELTGLAASIEEEIRSQDEKK